LDVEPEVAFCGGRNKKENMKRTNLAKYFLAYVGLAGFAVTVEASTTIVTPGSPGSWQYESIGYSGGGYTYTHSALPIVANPAAPATGASVQLETPAAGGAAVLSTTAYDGQLLSSINSLGYVEKTVQWNGQATPYFTIYVALNDGSGNYDKLFFEPTYQTPSPGPVVLDTWQTWNNINAGVWWDNNSVLGLAGGGYGSAYVNPLSVFLAQYPDATIADNSPFTAGGGISVTMGWNGGVNEGYVNDVSINGTTYDFEAAAPVPEPTTIIAGALLLLPFGASALRILRKKQTA
jgi:hypothetical protein